MCAYTYNRCVYICMLLFLLTMLRRVLARGCHTCADACPRPRRPNNILSLPLSPSLSLYLYIYIYIYIHTYIYMRMYMCVVKTNNN